MAAGAAGLAVVAVTAVGWSLTRQHSRPTSTLSSGLHGSLAAAGPCRYQRSGTAARAVDLPPSQPTSGPRTATMTTNEGVIAFTLNTVASPCTANAIISLAAQHYYDGTTCHRLTAGGLSVLQCGDPTASGSGEPGYAYDDENLSGATYPAGTVAMANAGPNTNGGQFFLVYADSLLSPNYTPVGKISSGLDVLTRVAAAGETPAGDGTPLLPVTVRTLQTGP